MSNYRGNFLAAIIFLVLIAQPALSEYSATDNVPPTITFNSPINGQNFNTHRVIFDVTIDGTGSIVREAFFNVLGDEVSYYSELENSANCNPVPGNSSALNCRFSYQITDGPAKVFSVLAFDYGIAYPGNSAEQGVVFSVNSRNASSPLIIIVPNVTQIVNSTNMTGNVTGNSTNSTVGNSTTNRTGGGGGGGSSGEGTCSEGSRRCYGSAVQSCSEGAWSVAEKCELGCDVKTKACVSDSQNANVLVNASQSSQLNETKNETTMSSQISNFLGEIYLPFYNAGKDNSWMLWIFLLAIVLLLAVLLKKK